MIASEYYAREFHKSHNMTRNIFLGIQSCKNKTFPRRYKHNVKAKTLSAACNGRINLCQIKMGLRRDKTFTGHSITSHAFTFLRLVIHVTHHRAI